MISYDTKRKVASLFYPRPSKMIAMLNGHANLVQWLKGQGAAKLKDRFELHDFVGQYVGDVPVDYLEFGVFEGESFRHWLKLNNHAQSRFVGFDSFTGLPEAWGDYLEKDHFSTSGVVPDVDDQRAEFVAGYFQDSLKPFLEGFRSEKQLIIHNDSDLYSSTLYTLATMNNYIRPGTIIIFDEFASPLHEFRAWDDYRSAFLREARLIAYTGEFATQAAFQVTS